MADLGTVVAQVTQIPAPWVQDLNDLAYKGKVPGQSIAGQTLGMVIDSIATLRTMLKTAGPRVFVTGSSAAGDGGGGQYYYDASDTTSTDNGGTIIVAADGGRWKRVPNGSPHGWDYATVGTVDQITNATFTGSPATGWTLSNFTSLNPGVQHAAGTVGSVTQNVTVTPFTTYLLSVTVTTTTQGGIAFSVNGVNVFDAGSYSILPVAGSTTYQFAWLSSTDNASEAVQLFTDTAWAGTITQFSVYKVQQLAPQDYIAQPTDDRSLNIPQGIGFGRFNAGVINIGDKQTGALGNSAAVWNISIGPRTLSSNVSGFENTAVGAFALQYSQSAGRLVAYGYSALKYNTTGIQNTALGYKCFVTNSTGNNNSGFGFWAGLYNTTGSQNTVGGVQAGYLNQTGNYLTALGYQAGLNSNGGTENTYLGALAGYLNASTSFTYSYNYTTSLGAEAKVYGNNGLAVGWLATVGSDPNAGGAAVDNAIAIGTQVTNKVASTAKIGNALSVTAVSGQLSSVQTLPAVTAGTGTTYTVAQMLGGVISRSGPAAGFSDTTPTAAQIVAAIGGCEVNSGFDLYIRNTSAFGLTLVAGAGVTLAGNTTVTAGQCRYYRVQVTNATAGSEAVFVLGVYTASN